jgi:hypothetical protein
MAGCPTLTALAGCFPLTRALGFSSFLRFCEQAAEGISPSPTISVRGGLM